MYSFLSPMFLLINHHKLGRSGFGLIELMVSMSIIVLVSSIIISRQSTFNSAIILRNQTYEVAFAIREAQQLAVSGGDESVRRYGLYFNTSTTSKQQYILFKDSNDSGTYDAGEQIGLTGKIDRSFEVRQTFIGVNPYTEMVILFERPNFDAKYFDSTGSLQNDTVAYIDIARSGQSGTAVGVVRRVEVTQTGQISVVTY